jgi:hypothetical protein
MESFMFGQRGGEGKGLAARGARIGPRSRVYADMNLKGIFCVTGTVPSPGVFPINQQSIF